MISQIRDFVLFTFVLIAGAVAGWASPANSKLLALVPEGAQIVAGIEDPHNPASNGSLLLVTHNCNLDFDDWVAITGVDPHRETDEVIEVATSSSEGDPQHPRGYRELRSNGEMRKLLDRKIVAQNGICGICKEKFTDYSDVVPDHISPRGMRGAWRDDHPDNIQAVHWWCNGEKGSSRY